MAWFEHEITVTVKAKVWQEAKTSKESEDALLGLVGSGENLIDQDIVFQEILDVLVDSTRKQIQGRGKDYR